MLRLTLISTASLDDAQQEFGEQLLPGRTLTEEHLVRHPSLDLPQAGVWKSAKSPMPTAALASPDNPAFFSKLELSTATESIFDRPVAMGSTPSELRELFSRLWVQVSRGTDAHHDSIAAEAAAIASIRAQSSNASSCLEQPDNAAKNDAVDRGGSGANSDYETKPE